MVIQQSGHAPKSELEVKMEVAPKMASRRSFLHQYLAASSRRCSPSSSFRVVDQNDEATFPRGLTSKSSPIVCESISCSKLACNELESLFQYRLIGSLKML